ncbi:MAG: Serine/threonine-protein kinase PknB [Planctomycetota bacterium]|jgi:formylglycine-generating enzyme required for sulfatase activity
MRAILALPVLLLSACGGGGDPYQPPAPPERPPSSASVRLSIADGRLADPGAEVPGDAGAISFRLVPGGEGDVFAQDRVTAAGLTATMSVATVPARWMATTELTRAQWRALVDASGATVEREPWAALPASLLGGAGDAAPAVNLNWNDIQAVLTAWNARAVHRLAVPTGARWEIAARGGTAGPWAWGADESLAPLNAVLGATGPAAVGGRPAAANGLRDTAGNAWEWVADGGSGGGPCLRGGAWNDSALSAQSGNRLDCPPGVRHPAAGVRLILETP